MDIVSLWGRVPPLLDACSHGMISVIKTLRLVNKEASQVALLGLKAHTLHLTGHNAYASVNGARLLKHTQLQELRVLLCLSGVFSPGIRLETYVREAGNSPRSLTSLSLLIEDKWPSDSTVTAATLDGAMTKLVGSCPALTSFTFKGHLSAEFLQTLGKRCPQLRQLTYICTTAVVQTDLKHVLLPQPSLVPHITTLTIDAGVIEYKLPDMSHNPSITTLNLSSFTFKTEEEWLCLPPKLLALRSKCIDTGPPDSTSNLLSHLITVELPEEVPCFPLHAICQLLRALPAFQHFKRWPPSNKHSCCIGLVLHPSTAAATAADMTFLQRKTHLPIIRDALYSIAGSLNETEQSLGSVIASLPRMIGAASFKTLCPGPGLLGLLLKVFPDVTYLGLHARIAMTNVELQALVVCVRLTTLVLARCPRLSPVGLFSICERLPQMGCVICVGCPLLGPAALEECEQLLRLQGSLTRLVCKDIG